MSDLSLCPPRLDGEDLKKKRAEILAYFQNSFELFEKLFDIFADEGVFYKKSEPTRHPMIFYFGHTAVFYINKLIAMKVISTRVNPSFESIFAVGVDEMSWDDLDKKEYEWPAVADVRAYRQEVKKVVEELIGTLDFTLPITQESAMWIILMGIEHERIHIETSSVLHRQLPIEDVKPSDTFGRYPHTDTTPPKNSLVQIPAATLRLGKAKKGDIYYGWDNEYGTAEYELKHFEVSKYLVSNAEFMEFVVEGGYEKEEYWTQEGWRWRCEREITLPPFWSTQEGRYYYRTLCEIIPLPLAWPVDVNAHEAEAYCRYLSHREGREYSLPSEAEYRAITDLTAEDLFTCKEGIANQNFVYASSTPVDIYPCELKTGEKIYDLTGNVWQWSRTAIYPFEGFEAHEAYDDFSIPTFDNKHALILGSSWASSGNLMMKHSRYAFRKHFYQHSGFRYVCSNNTDKREDMYETDELVSQYCEFQYGEEYFGVKNFAKSCVALAHKYMGNNAKALDLGCATGRASFELAKLFEKVEGVDFSTRFISVASRMQEEGILRYSIKTEGEIKEQKIVTLEELGLADIAQKVAFWQGDACNLKPYLQGYDLVLATNLIDRLYNPRLFLDDIASRMNSGGVLIITSPYTWQEESTKKEFWLGGYYDDEGEAVYTLETLKKVLQKDFEVVGVEDIAFVIRETKRKYQYTLSEASIWRKKDV